MRLDLGVGVVAHGGLDLFWSEIGALVDVVEVEPQTLWLEVPDGWEPDPEAMRWLADIDRPLLAHGVGFPVGGQLPPDPRGVELFADCCRRLQACHASEHLSFNRVAELDHPSRSARAAEDGLRHTGFLLPPRQTWETIEAAVCHIHQYQQLLDRPFLVETGVSYVASGDDELADGDFLRELVQRADCGILLDLHNLLANERNGRQPVADVLRSIPLDRVLEVHVAGGFQMGDYYLDAHSGPCDDALIRLLSDTLPMLPNVRAVVFEAMPLHLTAMGAGGLRTQLEMLHRVVDGSPLRSPSTPMRRTVSRIPAASRTSETTWQREVADYTTRRSEFAPSTDPGFDILRELTDAARLGRLMAADRELVASLARELGAEGVDALARRYLVECDARLWTSAEASAFRSWLARQ
ncbi:MAG: DUF692 family multinuclear iron-containing protein [Ilumatobacteraceae bacterium]